VAGTPFALLDRSRFVEALRFDAHHLETGHGIDLGSGLVYHLRFSLAQGTGWPLLAAAVGGMAVLLLTDWRKAALLVATPVAYYIAVGTGRTVFVRYMTPLVPFLCITAGVFVVFVAGRLRGVALAPAVAAGVVAIGAIPLSHAIAFDRLLAKTDSRATAAAWLTAHARPEDWLFQSPDNAVFNDFGFPAPMPVARIDRTAQTFVSETGEIVTPRWLVVEESPLLYTAGSAEILAQAGGRYETALVVNPTRTPEPAEWFDQQDAWYVPYANFSRRTAPGPAIRILRRADPSPVTPSAAPAATGTASATSSTR
jgi:hypothetical protein